jgi:hypothetical protein
MAGPPRPSLALPPAAADPATAAARHRGAAVPDPGEASRMTTERSTEAELTRALSVLARRALLGDVPAEERAELMDTLHQLAASLLSGPAGRTSLAAA